MSALPIAAGETLGPYRLEVLLGEGAMGVVFSARDGRGRRVAVKILRPEHSGERVALARFEREARVAGGIDPRHVVPVLDLGESEGLVYLVMPYYAGGSLAVRLRALGRVAPEEAVDLAAQLGRGLDELHAHDVLHRDVKPSNVLLDGEGAAALTDFGLARSENSTRITRDGEILGTPHYLAPELIAGFEASRATDIYALGCVLYECLVGEPPFAGRRLPEIAFGHLAEPPPDPRDNRPDLSDGMAEALVAALEKDPEHRPTSGTSLARMLHLGHSASPA
jgi:serine/threonine protein kinase